MKYITMMSVLMLALASVANTLSGNDDTAQARAQNPGLVGPAPDRAEAAQKTEAQAEKMAGKEQAAPADPGEMLKVSVVAVMRGKGVDRDLADIVRDAVEDTLDENGAIGSNDLDRELVKIRRNLINQGYYLSRIQRVGPNRGVTPEGALLLKLKVGTVQDIEIVFDGKAPGEDGTYFSNEQLQKRLDGVKEGDKFNAANLYLALYGFNAHPDLQADVKVGVTADKENDDANAKYTLVVKEDMPLHGSIEVNNYAIDALDNWQAVGMIQYLNLTKADDVLTFSPAMALNTDQWSVAANYTRPFEFWKGGDFSLWGAYSDTDVDNMDTGNIRDLEYEADGWLVGAQMAFNLLDTPDHRIQAFVNLSYHEIRQGLTWMDFDFARYHMGYLPITAGLSYMNRSLDALNGRNFLTFSGVYNIADFHDDIRDIWDDAETHYSLFRFQAARIQPLFGNMTLEQGFDSQWTAFLRMEGQWSNQSLISQEQALLGGHNNLRGYRTNGYAGSSAVYGTVEFRTPVWRNFISGFFRDNDETNSWIEAVQLLAFLDYGVVDRTHLRHDQPNSQFLCSAGLGARLQITKYLAINADIAVPIRDVNENADSDDDFEVYLGVRAQF